MPAGQLKINGVDAFTTWGISLDSTALSALMTPAPLKDMIENRSRLEHGVRRVRTNRKINERTIKLGLNMWANTESDFMTRYNNFYSAVLSAGQVNIEVPTFLPNVVFRCDFVSCDSYGVYQRQLAKFVLTLIESNPDNRSANNE